VAGVVFQRAALHLRVRISRGAAAGGSRGKRGVAVNVSASLARVRHLGVFVAS
jgi:hypothetical protein